MQLTLRNDLFSILLGFPLLLFASVAWPSGQPLDPALGEILFDTNCVVCHGMNGTGGRGPNLNRPQLQRAPDDAALRALIVNGIAPEMPPGWFFSDDEVTALAGYVRSLGRIPSNHVDGNAVAGAKIYQRSGCSSCHVLAGNGSSYGPELTDIGIRRSVGYLMQAIREPAATLPENFLLVAAKPRQGDAIQGIRANEDTFSIQIQDMQGRMFSFWKAELETLTKLKGVTPMPPFADALTDVELQDLVAFLMAPGNAT
jgi:cytochrome c oxidase cbb3-type subunit III